MRTSHFLSTNYYSESGCFLCPFHICPPWQRIYIRFIARELSQTLDTWHLARLFLAAQIWQKKIFCQVAQDTGYILNIGVAFLNRQKKGQLAGKKCTYLASFVKHDLRKNSILNWFKCVNLRPLHLLIIRKQVYIFQEVLYLLWLNSWWTVIPHHYNIMYLYMSTLKAGLDCANFSQLT